jgi:RNA polymerase sigma-70 factor, ECF subfamily
MQAHELEDHVLMRTIAAAFGKPDQSDALNDAVAALYDRYGKLVYSVAFLAIGRVDTAEEITQDVFVRVCKNAGSYQEEKGKVSSWLVQITRNRAIDELRHSSSRTETAQVEWPEDARQEYIFGLFTPDHPEEIVEKSLRDNSIYRLVGQLPLQQRQVLALAYFKGMSHNQIAALLKEPLGTVKSRVRLAMHKLRKLLVEHDVIEK